MAKASKLGPEFSQEREWRVVLEELQGQFRTFGEGLENVQRNLNEMRDEMESMKSDLAQLKVDVAVIKSAFPPFARQVSDHEHRITALERSH